MHIPSEEELLISDMSIRHVPSQCVSASKSEVFQCLKDIDSSAECYRLGPTQTGKMFSPE
jgi:hypothetical protein